MTRAYHYGVVLATDDPEQKGRLKIRCDVLEHGQPFGDAWIPGEFPAADEGHAVFFLPRVGDQVVLSVVDDPEAFVHDPDARWHAALFSDADLPPSEFRSNYPNRVGIKQGDQLLLMDLAQKLTALISESLRLGAEDATHPVIRGDTLNAELDLLLAALENETQIPTAALVAKDMRLKLATWLSTKVKTE